MTALTTKVAHCAIFGAEIGIVTLPMVKTVDDTCQAFYWHILCPPPSDYGRHLWMVP